MKEQEYKIDISLFESENNIYLIPLFFHFYLPKFLGKKSEEKGMLSDSTQTRNR
jgi:hypothetical protein